MSARDEIASELWLVMPSADDDEAREAAAKLLDAYAAEVRSAVLREAADVAEGFGEHSSPQMGSLIRMLRRMAAEETA